MENKDSGNFNQSQQQQDSPISDKIDVNNIDHVRRCASECGVSEAEIREAVSAVGSSKSKINEYLKDHKDTSSRDTGRTGTNRPGSSQQQTR
jgi:hypothetical protein